MRQAVLSRVKITLLLVLFFLPVFIAAWAQQLSDAIAVPQRIEAPPAHAIQHWADVGN